MSFILEHFRSVLTSQLIQESSSKGFSQTKEARSNVRPLADHVVATRWRPWTLHPAALLSTLLFTLGIIGILEYLQRSSNANHGIAFASSRDAFSGATTFLSLYLPTLLAVLFSMWWSWVDLDIKRLEPWYQLISLKTTKMRCSLLLQYPVEFLAWIPFRAARRRFVKSTLQDKGGTDEGHQAVVSCISITYNGTRLLGSDSSPERYF